MGEDDDDTLLYFSLMCDQEKKTHNVQSLMWHVVESIVTKAKRHNSYKRMSMKLKRYFFSVYAYGTLLFFGLVEWMNIKKNMWKKKQRQRQQ